MANHGAEPAQSLLTAEDLRRCASHYRWSGRTIGSLLAAFPDDGRLDAEGLASIDAWVKPSPTPNERDRPRVVFDRLSAPPLAARIVAAAGARPLGELRKRMATASPRRLVTSLLRASTLHPHVPEELAFPFTVLLRCLVPRRFPILTRPLEVAEIVVPSEIRRRVLRAGRKRTSATPRGVGWPWAWRTQTDFVTDYLAYASWHRALARRAGVEEPGVLDDGCWQLSRCLADAPCPGKGAGSPLCPTGTSVLRNGPVRRLLGVPGDRHQIFLNILDMFGEAPLGELSWDDVAEMLMPDPVVVRRLLARARAALPPTGHGARSTRGRDPKRPTMLRGLERAFGEHLLRELVDAEPSLGRHPYVLGERLATHGTVIKRYLDRMSRDTPWWDQP